MIPAPPLVPAVTPHTAAQIAAALGLSKRGVRYGLQGIPPDTRIILNGQPVDAWLPSSLPARYQAALAGKAEAGRYRDGGHLLKAAAAPWQPSLPLRDVAPHHVDKAVKLQRALRPMAERRNDPGLTAGEFEQRGVELYAREFGHGISARHWRRLFQRTIERDRGAENWSRLEIYLDERLSPKAESRAIPAAGQRAVLELAPVIAAFKNPAQPSRDEITCLWLRAFEFFEQQIGEGQPEPATRRGLLEFLWAAAPFLARSRSGLARQFDRKLEKWRAGGRASQAVEDRRRHNSGWFRAPEITPEDRDCIVAKAVLETGGRVSQAWRELKRENRLGEAIAGHYLANPASKSYVPQTIRRLVTPAVRMLEDIHHGPRQARLNGAHISRDWSNVFAGDWFQADDCTAPIYYFEPDGNGWFTLWRGQLLVMIDLRTTRILAYVLISDRNYNSLAIRTLITRACDEHGLPRKGFYFESGIWKTSKILTGDKPGALSWPEAEKGLRDLGLRFVHAELPRAKPVERVLGAVQDQMEGLPGYCGRDERHDRFERFEQLKRQVESRKVDPRGLLFSADEWLAKLDKVCAAYNAEPQDGRMLEGRSPDSAFAALQRADDPPIRFDAACRYLLAHHRRPTRVTRNGITLRFGKRAFTYRNEQTGRLIGQPVLAWFNPETPEILCVTDMNRQNAFAVERAQDVPAMDAPPELLGAEQARINAHLAPARAYYRTLRAAHAPQFRQNVIDPATADLGEAFEREQAAARDTMHRQRRLSTQAAKVERQLGMLIPAAARCRPESVQAAEELAEMLSDQPEPTGGEGA